MQCREPARPARQVRVVRVTEPVVVGVRLARQARGERGVAIDVAEPPRAIRPDVEPRVASRDPAGDRAADPAPTPEPIERQPGRDPEPTDPCERPQQRVRIRCHRVRVADQADRLGVGEEREASDGARHQWREALVVRRHGLRRVVPWDAVLPARTRIRLIPAEDHPAVLALARDEVVGITETRHLARQLGAGHRLERDVLVIDRGRGDERPDHRRHLGRPDPGRIDDEFGGDRPLLRQHGRDLATGRQLEPRDANAGPDPDPECPRGVGHCMGRAVRVEMTVAGQVDGPVQRPGRDRGHEPARLVGADDPRLEPDPARPARRPFELAELRAARCQAQAPHRLEGAEAAVQVDAVAAELHHRG